MSKYLILLAVMVGLLSGCNHSRDAEAKAFSAGCSHGISVVLAQLGAQPNEAKVAEHCDKEAQEYLKNNK